MQLKTRLARALRLEKAVEGDWAKVYLLLRDIPQLSEEGLANTKGSVCRLYIEILKLCDEHELCVVTQMRQKVVSNIRELSQIKSHV